MYPMSITVVRLSFNKSFIVYRSPLRNFIHKTITIATFNHYRLQTLGIEYIPKVYRYENFQCKKIPTFTKII